MLRKPVRHVVAALPLAVILCSAATAQAAPLNVSGILALSEEGAGSPARTSSTSSSAPSISADGMMVAFASNAADLNADHPSGTTQIYVLNRYSGTTRLVSRESGYDGAPGAGSSTQPSISADGRFVAFASASNNLTDDDGTDNQDVFVRDLTNNATRLVSRDGGTAAAGTSNQPAVSPDGRYVAYTSSADNLSDADGDGTKDVFIHDRSSGTSTLASVGTGGPALGDSQHPAITAIGAVVAFESTASNLATGDAAGASDVFAYDTRSGETTLVSRATGATGTSPTAASFAPSISADGRVVAFASDADLDPDSTPGVRDVFARNLQTDETTFVSRAGGPSGAASDADSDQAAVSPDGGYVAFRSAGANLSSVDGDPDTDVFVRDLSDGALALASRASGGPAANGASSEPVLGAAAGTVVFSSQATNLVSSSPGGGTNVFATSMRSTLDVTASEPPAVNGGLSRFTTNVSCSTMCFVWATAKLTVTDGQGNSTSRNAGGYGAQFLASTAPQSITVYLMPATVSWLKRELAAGSTATVQIKLQATGMRGEKATGYANGPVTLPAPAPAG